MIHTNQKIILSKDNFTSAFIALFEYIFIWRVPNMRFCDFFIDYKIGIADIDKYIKYKDLPFYRKLFVTIAYIAILLMIILFITIKREKIIYLPLVVSVVVFALI